MNYLIMGYGEIGRYIGEKLYLHTFFNDNILAYDVNENGERIIIPLRPEHNIKFNGEFDCAMVCLPTHEDGYVDVLINELNKLKTKRVIIHSTIQHPNHIDAIRKNVNIPDIVYLPERYNGTDEKNNEIFQDFEYCGIIKTNNKNKLKEFLNSICIAQKLTKKVKELVLAKLYENIQRNTLIQLANKMELFSIKNGIDFDKVQNISKTKSNFVHVESGYVSGHCLPFNHRFIGFNKVNLNKNHLIDSLDILSFKMSKIKKIFIFGLSYKNFSKKRMSEEELNGMCEHPFLKGKVQNKMGKLVDFEEFYKTYPKTNFKDSLIIILRWNEDVSELIDIIHSDKKIKILDLFGSVKTKKIKLISLKDLKKDNNEL